MSLSPSHSLPHDSEKLTLPSFSEFVKASCPLGSITVPSTSLYIHPPTFDPPPPVAPTTFKQPVQTRYYPKICGLLLEQFSEVRVHFRGPAMRYLHGGNSVLPIPPATESRINLSWAAYLRRFKEHGQDPLLCPPTVPREVVEIDLCHVDFWAKTSTVKNQIEFSKILRELAPSRIAEIGGCEEHSVLEWDIVCPDCGEAVTHHYFDEHWNGRYIFHRLSPQCKIRQFKPLVVPAAPDIMAARAARRYLSFLHR